MDFNSIIGHEKVIEVLKNSIKHDSISHAYLFKGEKGIGKSLTSHAFSKALLCTGDGEKPCGICSSCKRFEIGNNPDFFHIKPEKNMIRKTEIEIIQNEMTTSPINSKKKIIIIEEAHFMNKESTNKLLKTLEEPPSFVHIILISSYYFKLLPTILSRVQIINFSPVSQERIIDLLVKDYEKTREQAEFITEFTKGIIGNSINLAQDQSLFQRREEILNILDNLIRGDKTKIFYFIDFVNKNEEYIDEILNTMIYYFRDLLLYKRLGNDSFVLNKDKISLLQSHSFMDFNKINDIILNIIYTKDIIKKNINFQLSLETMLLNI